MKKLLTVLLLALSFTASAADKVESAYYQVERNVKIVITNQPCEKFKSDRGEELGFAYAINTDTADTVTGCFSTRDGIIHIELSSDDNVEHYTYDYNVRKFQPSETL